MDTKMAIEQVRKIVCDKPDGNRHIVVLDRGWIFVGDLELPSGTSNLYRLTNCKNVRKWAQNGFGGLTKSAKYAGATLDDCEPIAFAAAAMILAVPIGGDWDA